MRRLVIALSLLLIVSVMLSGCMLLGDKAQVRALVEKHDLSGYALSNDDLTTTSTVQSVTPQWDLDTVVAAKYTYLGTDKNVHEVVVDEEVGYATADVAFTIKGKVELFNITASIVATKDANLYGQVKYYAQKENGEWKITDFDLSMSTSTVAPVVGEVVVEPQPVQAGELLTVKAAISGLEDDIVVVLAETLPIGYIAQLTDFGDVFGGADEFPGDGQYTGAQTLFTEIQPGIYIGAVKAISLGDLLNPIKDDNGDFLPIKITIKTFKVEVVE